MEDHIYKKLEIVGTSTESIDAAIKNAIARAGETIDNLRWFEVSEIRGDIRDQKPQHWQVTVKMGFTLNH